MRRAKRNNWLKRPGEGKGIQRKEPKKPRRPQRTCNPKGVSLTERSRDAKKGGPFLGLQPPFVRYGLLREGGEGYDFGLEGIA